MPSPLCLTVNVIGHRPRPEDPPELAPQFVNPVPVRVYTAVGVRSAIAWLRIELGSVVAEIHLPPATEMHRARCFCCTVREHEPRTHIERRRITSIDLCLV